MRQQRDVVPPFAQGRQMNADALDSIVQILAKFLRLHHLTEIAIGGADQTDIHPDRVVAAEPHDLAILQNTQQLRLHRPWHIADFVHEERAAVGVLEAAFALALRAVNAPFTCPKSSSSRMLSLSPAQLNATSRCFRRRLLTLDRPGDQFLAGAAFAGDQDGRIGLGDLPGDTDDVLHRHALADDPFEVSLAGKQAVPASPGSASDQRDLLRRPIHLARK